MLSLLTTKLGKVCLEVLELEFLKFFKVLCRLIPAVTDTFAFKCLRTSGSQPFKVENEAVYAIRNAVIFDIIQAK